MTDSIMRLEIEYNFVKGGTGYEGAGQTTDDCERQNEVSAN